MGSMWNDNLTVNNRTIDSHHKKLFDMFDAYHEAMKAGQARSVVSGMLVEIKNYTAYHFNYEEGELAKANYPKLEEHKKIHRQFEQQIDTLIDSTKNNDLGATLKTNKVLSEWLRGHIMGRDQEYVDYLK